MHPLSFLTIAIMASSAFAGNMDFDRCGGIGTIVGLRISDCEGRVCYMDPGKVYSCEGDVFPSQAISSLWLKVTADYLGHIITLINTELPNSSVQPGNLYTIHFTVVPNDVLAEEYFPVQTNIMHTATGTLEFCARFHVRVNALP